MPKIDYGKRPFRKILHKFGKKISKECVENRDFENRLYHVGAWAQWLLFDLRYAPTDKHGFRNIDSGLVNKYKPTRKVSGLFGREACEEPPLNWIERSIEVLVDEEIIHDNGKTGALAKYRPSKYLLKLWDEADVLEGQFNPFAEADQVSINKLNRDVKRLKMIIRELCKLTGCELEP